jgi:hypothetical protein
MDCVIQEFVKIVPSFPQLWMFFQLPHGVRTFLHTWELRWALKFQNRPRAAGRPAASKAHASRHRRA